MATLKVLTFWFGVNMNYAQYTIIEVIGILIFAWTLTLGQPKAFLAKVRPTASLLGATTLFSAIGQHVINMTILGCSLRLIMDDPGYFPWPSQFGVASVAWYTWSDNWECTTLYTVVSAQFVTAAMVFSTGASFRKPLFFNVPMWVFWSLFIALWSCSILTTDTYVARVFHMASIDFNGPNTTSPAWVLSQSMGNPTSPPMSYDLRLHLWGLIVGGLCLNAIWQVVLIDAGLLSKFLRRLWPNRHYVSLKV